MITVLCLTPGDQLPKIEWEIISIGTAAHFCLYFGLCFLMLMAFLNPKKNHSEKKLNPSTFKLYLSLTLFGIAFGYLIELLQGNFIYRRYYDPEDIVVNAIGTIFGALSYTWIGRKIV